MGGPQGQESLTTNQKVVVWARGNLGKKIGRGLCWDLGEQALKQAGAKTSNDLGPVGDDTDYIWGDPIDDVKDVQPGDILQIRNHLVTITTKSEYVFQDKSTATHNDETYAKRGHHTAIVNGMLDDNGAVRTLEQHVRPGGDIIQNMRLYTRDVPAVVTKTSERHTNPSTKKLEMATVTRTVTITVTGTIWAYRPKPKKDN
jgi:hypothetical protein